MILAIYSCTKTQNNVEVSVRDVDVVKSVTDYHIPTDRNDNIFGKRKFDRLSAEKILKRHDGYYLVTEIHNEDRFKDMLVAFIDEGNKNLQKIIDDNNKVKSQMLKAFSAKFGV